MQLNKDYNSEWTIAQLKAKEQNLKKKAEAQLAKVDEVILAKTSKTVSCLLPNIKCSRKLTLLPTAPKFFCLSAEIECLGVHAGHRVSHKRRGHADFSRGVRRRSGGGEQGG